MFEPKLHPKGKGGRFIPTSRGSAIASEHELAQTRKLARAKIRNAPVPSETAVAKARAELKSDKGRPGGESRGGSASARRQQRKNLFAEFGGDRRGYVVCHVTGLKMHWSSDPAENPEGYPLFERGKIFTKAQGGGYQLPNLLPESFQANRSRQDRPLRKENRA